MNAQPVRIVVTDDLRRSRLTVFFRLLLAIPHFIWLALWGALVVFVALLNWIATLFSGESPKPLHDFLAAYVRYTVHVDAYVFLAANPFPGFTGEAGKYPIDIEIDPPRPQNRWKTGFRGILFVPALLVTSAFVGTGTLGRASGGGSGGGWGAVIVAAVLTWFAALVLGRAPRGLRDLSVYGLGYSAWAWSYFFLLTDRYPFTGPTAYVPTRLPEHPVQLRVEDDLRRSRLTVFFRLLLALPHIVWLLLWTIAAIVAAIAGWFAMLARGHLPAPLHRFLSAYVRYQMHVNSFTFLVANPFPGFVGKPGYPVEIQLPDVQSQNRWTVGFRIFLAVPAILVASGVGNLLYACAFLGWFVSLAHGRMPQGLRDAGAYALRYSAQQWAYVMLVTGSYPDATPSY
jgi:hypothetical protein